MSRTYKDKPTKLRFPKYPYGIGYNCSNEDLPKLPKEVDTEWHWLSATPSWWTNMLMNRPQRREAQQWSVKALLTEIEDLDTLDKPNVSHKPHQYYW